MFRRRKTLKTNYHARLLLAIIAAGFARLREQVVLAVNGIA